MPLDFHKDAPLAALASMAAHEQGKFWEFHDKVFSSQPKIQKDFLLQYAKELGLDLKRFQSALDSARFQPAIDADKAEAGSLGVSGTPAFFVNGRFLSGAKPFEEFAKVINEELKKKNLPIPAGAAGA
jgi:predicted DsbA family dithiol-disulfide isomerase